MKLFPYLDSFKKVTSLKPILNTQKKEILFILVFLSPYLSSCNTQDVPTQEKYSNILYLENKSSLQGKDPYIFTSQDGLESFKTEENIDIDNKNKHFATTFQKKGEENSSFTAFFHFEKSEETWIKTRKKGSEIESYCSDHHPSSRMTSESEIVTLFRLIFLEKNRKETDKNVLHFLIEESLNSKPIKTNDRNKENLGEWYLFKEENPQNSSNEFKMLRFEETQSFAIELLDYNEDIHGERAFICIQGKIIPPANSESQSSTPSQESSIDWVWSSSL